MNRASLLITLLMGVLTIVLWALVNRPGIEPPWPAKIDGFSFSPMRGEQSPLSGTQPSIGEIDADLALLAGDPGAALARALVGGEDDASPAESITACLAAYQAAGFGRFAVEAMDWPNGRAVIRGEDAFETWPVRRQDERRPLRRR